MKLKPQIFLILFCFLSFSLIKAQDLSQSIQSPKKAAIIYAGLLTSAYYINDNNNRYKQYKEAYIIRIDNNPNTTDNYVGEYSSGDLLILKDFYRRNREISILCFVGTYIVNVVDASVDAHLFDYDISDDISLHITPTSTTDFYGLTLSLNL